MVLGENHGFSNISTQESLPTCEPNLGDSQCTSGLKNGLQICNCEGGPRRAIRFSSWRTVNTLQVASRSQGNA
jgi:hypothetical protein